MASCDDDGEEEEIAQQVVGARGTQTPRQPIDTAQTIPMGQNESLLPVANLNQSSMFYKVVMEALDGISTGIVHQHTTRGL